MNVLPMFTCRRGTYAFSMLALSHCTPHTSHSVGVGTGGAALLAREALGVTAPSPAASEGAFSLWEGGVRAA